MSFPLSGSFPGSGSWPSSGSWPGVGGGSFPGGGGSPPAPDLNAYGFTAYSSTGYWRSTNGASELAATDYTTGISWVSIQIYFRHLVATSGTRRLIEQTTGVLGFYLEVTSANVLRFIVGDGTALRVYTGPTLAGSANILQLVATLTGGNLSVSLNRAAFSSTACAPLSPAAVRMHWGASGTPNSPAVSMDLLGVGFGDSALTIGQAQQAPADFAVDWTVPDFAVGNTIKFCAKSAKGNTPSPQLPILWNSTGAAALHTMQPRGVTTVNGFRCQLPQVVTIASPVLA